MLTKEIFHKFSHRSAEQHRLEAERIAGLSVVKVNDNIDTEDFIRHQDKQNNSYKVDISNLKEAMDASLPPVLKDGVAQRLPLLHCEKKCFWQKLDLKGSEQPAAKENATFMPNQFDARKTLYLVGGAPMTTG